ncbi:unnamed protein product [Medioppia subpectinata]|uniref:Uncharacterized protein n=1 Tax=Medioppia subpectinata TaxID=1979941 RepID=A0A7R9Q011_9ACAR|nr:unnamed protein product [Medioppia subpectinata]CAG2107051.1 unnamed protein product [Medioppia subpectinata]
MKFSTVYLSHLLVQSICCVFAVHIHHNNHHNHHNNNYHNHNIRNNIISQRANTRHEHNVWYFEDSDDGNNSGQREGGGGRAKARRHLVLQNYQRYRPNHNETVVSQLLVNSVTTGSSPPPPLPPLPSVPPYYLSYDSGQKSRYMPTEEKLIEQQMASNYHWPSELASDERTDDKPNDSVVKPNVKNTRIESQILDSNDGQNQLPNSIDIYGAHNADGIRRAGPKGMKGTFGFNDHGHFYPCDKPSRLVPDPHNRETYIIPNNIGYYHKCRYFDDDPRADKSRPVGPLGMDGYFGYFDNHRFVECAPPRQLLEDSQHPGLYFIPVDIYYEPKCQYYGYNMKPKKRKTTEEEEEGEAERHHTCHAFVKINTKIKTSQIHDNHPWTTNGPHLCSPRCAPDCAAANTMSTCRPPSPGQQLTYGPPNGSAFGVQAHIAMDCSPSGSHFNELNILNVEHMEIDYELSSNNESMEVVTNNSKFTEAELWLHKHNEEKKHKNSRREVQYWSNGPEVFTLFRKFLDV